MLMCYRLPINGLCVFLQSVGVPRSSDRQRPMWSLRCCLFTGTFEVRSLTRLDFTRYLAELCLSHVSLWINGWFLSPSALFASLRSEAKKTKVKRKTNNPQFEEVFYFEVSISVCDLFNMNLFVIVKMCFHVGYQSKYFSLVCLSKS